MPAPQEFHDSTLYLIFSGKGCNIQGNLQWVKSSEELLRKAQNLSR
ncbi:hypothetical protein PN480_19230 [Dolichospermum circinale CS-1225]|nr:hypothetical protein [Dolichospermum circinale CS-1225]